MAGAFSMNLPAVIPSEAGGDLVLFVFTQRLERDPAALFGRLRLFSYPRRR
jgi:hypothetical protein